MDVQWSVSGNTAHSGSFSLDWLKENDYSNSKSDHNTKPLLAVTITNYYGIVKFIMFLMQEALSKFGYDDVMMSDDGLYQ